jgi:hypothetical protein
MIEFIFLLLEPFVWIFAAAYNADERPEARRITIGCGLMCLALVGLVVLLMALGRMK